MIIIQKYLGLKENSIFAQLGFYNFFSSKMPTFYNNNE